MLFLEDKIPITDSERQYTDEGFLMVPARISRIGTQVYLAAEMGLTDREPNDPVVVYRPEEEVFKPESLSSFANKPVTDNHPPELVNASNSRKYSVGHAGPEVTRDGMFATTVLYVTDEQAIKNIESGKTELSNGYVADIDWTPGISPEGEQYDAVQRNIKGNHIAIVDRGRAGPACRVADNLPNQEDVIMAKITIDGVDYEVSEQAAQAVGKVLTRLTDAESNLEEKDEELKKKDEELEKKDEDMEEAVQSTKDSMQAKIDDAKSKIPTAANLDKMVADRAALVSQALKVVPDLEWEGKDADTLKREVVAAKCSNVQMDSVSADYVSARFDMLVESVDGDSTHVIDAEFQKQVKDDDSKKVEDSRPADVIARERMMADSRDAWKGANK